MKIYYTIVSLLLLSYSATSQCINGNCENGIGSAYIGEAKDVGRIMGTADFKLYSGKGVYVGPFVAGEPHGNGKLTIIKAGYNIQDSVLCEGFFQYGYFIKGTITVLASWSDAYNYTSRIQFWSNNPERAGMVISYPEQKYKTIDGKKYAEWEYTDFKNNKSIKWSGKLKNDLMNGEGELGNEDNKIKLTFNEGMPKGEIKVLWWNNKKFYHGPKYVVDDFKLTNDMVTTFKITDPITKSKMESTQPVYILSQLSISVLNGGYNVYYASGDTYSGNFNDMYPEGYGVYKNIDGFTRKGYFKSGVLHGEGVMKDNIGGVDSGFFLYNKFVKGVCTRANKEVFNFPICLSGNCENGFGKANYTSVNSNSSIDEYEGNFVNGFKCGLGKSSYKKENYVLSKSGTFSSGLLNGYAVITANEYSVRKMEGTFSMDTLMQGKINYDDNTSFEYEEQTDKDRISNIKRMMIYGKITAKTCYGNGVYYLKSGSIITGLFNSAGGLIDGSYLSSSGISIKMGPNEQTYYYSQGIGDYGGNKIDMLDNIAQKIVAVNAQAESTKKAQAAAYYKERQRKDEEEKNRNNPANWKNTSDYVKCGACNGTGEFQYSNTFGRVEEVVTYKDGSKVNLISNVGRTYITKVKCSACDGARKIFVNSKIYIGPK